MAGIQRCPSDTMIRGIDTSWKVGDLILRECLMHKAKNWDVNHIYSSNCSDFSMSMLSWWLQTNLWVTESSVINAYVKCIWFVQINISTYFITRKSHKSQNLGVCTLHDVWDIQSACSSYVEQGFMSDALLGRGRLRMCAAFTFCLAM